MYEKRIESLKELDAVQSSNGNWNYDPYMMGLANGIILAVHIMTGAKGTPAYKTGPVEWLKDRPGFVPELGSAQVIARRVGLDSPSPL